LVMLINLAVLMRAHARIHVKTSNDEIPVAFHTIELPWSNRLGISNNCPRLN